MTRTPLDLVSRIIAAVAIVAVFALASPASACPSCKGAVEANDHATAGHVGAGFSYSVLFMMAMPFMLAGGFGLACWMHLRKMAQPAQFGGSLPHGQASASAGPPEPREPGA
jgi:hypothetical protein